MHYAGAGGGQLQHFVVADLADVAGLRHDAGIGRIDAVDVGIDLARRRVQHRRQGHGGRVAAAAAQRGDVRLLVDPLEAGGDDDVALVQGLADAVGGDRLDAGFRVRAVGDDANLGPVRLRALRPSEWMAIAIKATLTCSPVESSMSISRAGGWSVICRARSISKSVLSPIALTTTTT